MVDSLAPASSLSSLNPSDLLVADAESSSLEICREVLKDLNLTIREAPHADTVMDALESALVDILVLSQELPGAQDLELLRHVHYWYPETQVVMIADTPSYAAAVQAAKTGRSTILRSRWSVWPYGIQSSARWNSTALKEASTPSCVSRQTPMEPTALWVKRLP